MVSIVGMAGAGKSEVSRVFERNGYILIRFGDVTDEEIKKRGLELSEKNEHNIRLLVREKHGMEAYAKLNLARINSALEHTDVVIDGLYSWEEYIFLKEYYRDGFFVVAVCASPKTRHDRLATRSNRRLKPKEAVSRDKEEIEDINKGGPIAMADFTIVNDSSREDLIKESERIVALLK